MLEPKGQSLVVKDLSVQFGAAEPVRDVHLELGRGRSLGVVGESGSGKSLTALAIMGLLPSTAAIGGSMLWGERNLATASERDYQSLRGQEIAMIFQDPMSSLNPSFTIGYQIDEVLRLKLGLRDKTARRERGLKLLSEVGIPAPMERWNSYPHQLSGGMSQRVCIAMALACEPMLLIADEPTTALDVTVQMQILDLLVRLKNEKHMSLLFITHDLAVAARVCDDIAVFYAGRSVERGPAAQILMAPAHPYTQALLRARPSHGAEARSALRSIEGVVPRATEKISSCAFAPRCDQRIEACTKSVPPRVSGAGQSEVACFLGYSNSESKKSEQTTRREL